MRVTPKALIVVLVAVFAAAAGFELMRRAGDRGGAAAPVPAGQGAASGAYAEAGSCATCHVEIARTYAATGMARSAARVPASAPLADFTGRNRLYHAPSERHYTMIERGGRYFQRRHEVGPDGAETSVIEVEAHFAIGSGNHARTFIHRKPDGRLVEMPVSWYAEGKGFWAMSPGYDRPAHMDFRRLIPEDCMACHNAYPRAPVEDAGNGPRFPEPLPEGIGCQRCHGPGQAHVDAATANDLDAARRAIVNPAALPRERQLETCFQCHLEPTSSPLPFQLRRFDRPPFSYVPGKPLADYFLYFDHAPGSGRDDKFEIAGGAYRLRLSPCFKESEMTCGTCHDPHDIPRGEPAVAHYVSVCQSCHASPHPSGAPAIAGPGPRSTCLDCHMPKRRAEDAVHVVMTDHFIQRRRPSRDLLAPRTERETLEHGAYRGEVVPYYPLEPAPTPDNELYLALAQVAQGVNMAAGLPRLERAIARHQPAGPHFYFELARAHAKHGSYDQAIRWADEALRRDATFAPALKELAGAATAMGRLVQASEALEKAVALRPQDADAWNDLGNVYLQLDRLEPAVRALDRALALDPSLPRAHNTRGLAALRQGASADAEIHFRESLRHQPDLAEARNNLGNLLAGRRAYEEAAYHFERAVRSNPDYVEARHSYGMVLALMQLPARAIVELEAAARLAPRAAAVHLDLGDVLASAGRRADAARAYQRAIEHATDPEIRSAAAAALAAIR